MTPRVLKIKANVQHSSAVFMKNFYLSSEWIWILKKSKFLMTKTKYKYFSSTLLSEWLKINNIYLWTDRYGTCIFLQSFHESFLSKLCMCVDRGIWKQMYNISLIKFTLLLIYLKRYFLNNLHNITIYKNLNDKG